MAVKDKLTTRVEERIEKRKGWSKTTKLVIGAITLLAFLIFLSGINEPHLNPFKSEIKLQNANSLGVSSDNMAIVDSQNKRIIITDIEGKAQSIIDMNKSGSPVDEVSSVAIDGDTLYVAGYKLHNDGEYLTNETISTYDLKGKFIETKYTKEYGDDEYVTTPMIRNIYCYENDSYVIAANDKNVKLYNLSKSDKEPVVNETIDEYVYGAIFLPQLKKIVAIGRSMTCYTYTLGSGWSESMSFNALIRGLAEQYNIDSDSIKKMTTNTTLRAVLDKNGDLEYLAMLDTSADETVVYVTETMKEIRNSSLKLGGGLMLKNILFWIAIAWIGLIALGMIIYLLLFKLDSKGRAVLVFIGCLLFASMFYSNNIRKSTAAVYENNVVSLSNQFATIEERSISALQNNGFNFNSDIETYCSDVSHAESIEADHQLIKEFCDDMGKDGSYYARLYLVDGDQIYTYVDSANQYPAGMNISWNTETNELINNARGKGIIKVEDRISTKVVSTAEVHNSAGEVVGIIEVGFKESNLMKVQKNTTSDIFINLLAIFIAVFISYAALGDVFKDVKKYKGGKAEGIQGSEAYLTSAFNILYKFMTGIDAVIVVYVAKSLCADMSATKQAAMVALPAAALSVGLMIGEFLAPVMFKKLGMRLSAMVSLVATIGTFAIMIVAIMSGSIYIYIAGKFVNGIFATGVTYMVGDTLPYSTTNGGVRSAALKSSQQSSTAAAIISTIVGGYISQLLSYSFIYILAAVFAVGLLVLCFFAFAAYKKPEAPDKDDKAAKKAATKNVWKTILSPAIIMYIIGYIIPNMLFGGYSGYLFPLYSAGAGLTALLLSNLSAFSKTVSYITFNPIQDFAKQFNQTVVMIVALMIDAVCLICFIISPNIYWAIAVLFIFAVTNGVSSLGSKVYIADVSDEAGIDQKDLRNNTNLISSVLYVFQSPALSAFVGLGMNAACAAVGAVSGVMVTVFGGFLGSRKKKKQEAEASIAGE